MTNRLLIFIIHVQQGTSEPNTLQQSFHKYNVTVLILLLFFIPLRFDRVKNGPAGYESSAVFDP